MKLPKSEEKTNLGVGGLRPFPHVPHWRKSWELRLVGDIATNISTRKLTIYDEIMKIHLAEERWKEYKPGVK